MKKIRITLIILLIVLISLPLFAQKKRGRRQRMAVSPLTISLYYGAEDLTGVVAPDSSMYSSFGVNAIIPVIQPMMLRLSLLNFSLHKDWSTIDVGTGLSADIMYYWQVPMAFTPYGFAGFCYNSSYSDETSSSSIDLRAGVGGQMKAFYNFFAEFGLDFQQTNYDGNSNSITPFFAHAGVRFPLFR